MLNSIPLTYVDHIFNYSGMNCRFTRDLRSTSLFPNDLYSYGRTLLSCPLLWKVLHSGIVLVCATPSHSPHGRRQVQLTELKSRLHFSSCASPPLRSCETKCLATTLVPTTGTEIGSKTCRVISLPVFYGLTKQKHHDCYLAKIRKRSSLCSASWRVEIP
ncbi:hypothetical protein N656DRAFT_186369 [Canariomyces notabilis]|uniref:Uncharacterized protein n=1 Tax=Canariomyces notabilis TaxID=2074819 RepID=A0AAN6QJ63_9PEZI|nr:hypothetical protein N656DRAFT_186369 [Canariomyces arenarius]